MKKSTTIRNSIPIHLFTVTASGKFISGAGNADPFQGGEIHTAMQVKAMEKLVTIAERGCIVANTIKNAVKLTFTIA